MQQKNYVILNFDSNNATMHTISVYTPDNEKPKGHSEQTKEIALYDGSLQKLKYLAIERIPVYTNYRQARTHDESQQYEVIEETESKPSVNT